jgi:hypothetical protein
MIIWEKKGEMPWKSPPVPTEKEAKCAPKADWTFRSRKNFFSLLGFVQSTSPQPSHYTDYTIPDVVFLQTCH